MRSRWISGIDGMYVCRLGMSVHTYPLQGWHPQLQATTNSTPCHAALGITLPLDAGSAFRGFRLVCSAHRGISGCNRVGEVCAL